MMVSSFSEAIESLLTLALIRRNKDSRAFSLHRLVQTSFKFFMPPDQKQKSFNDAAILVSLAFPRRDNAEGHMYLVWERCALYLKQVLGLRDCFREEKKANPAFSAVFQYCDLNNACQRQVILFLRKVLDIDALQLPTRTPGVD